MVRRVVTGLEKERKKEQTFGGLPLFFFKGSASTADGPEAAPASGAGFLFLLPLGRPRPRLTGGAAVAASGWKQTK
jgi:hypothetical protein